MSRPHRIDAERDLYLVRELNQLEALESPARCELVDTFAATGPASIAEVALRLGRTPASLYYHVERLVEVGLLLEAGEHAEGRVRKRLYRTPARQLVLASPGRSHRKQDAIVRIMLGNLRLTERDVERAFRDPASRFSGPDRNVYAARTKAWLTDDERAEAVALIERLDTLMEGGRPGPNRELFALNVALTPVLPRKNPDRDR